MALYAELLKRFKQDDVPLLDRLLAARTLFLRSEFYYISRKEELVLDWLLELTNHEFKHDVWLIIRDCLQSKHVMMLKIVDLKAETKGKLVKLLIQFLEAELLGKTQRKKRTKKKEGSLQTAVCNSAKESQLLIECSLLILENNVFLFYFRKNFNNYISLSNIILKYVAENADVKTLLRYIKSLMYFCNQSLKKKDFYESFIDKLFFPIVEAFCSLKKLLNTVHKLEVYEMLEDKHFTEEQVEYLKSELLVLIIQVIFPSYRYRKLTNDLVNLFNKNSFNSLTMRMLCQVLTNNASSQREVIMNLYSLVFEAFVRKSQNNFNLIFQFFVTLCSLLGFEVTVQKQQLHDLDETCLLKKESISIALSVEISYPDEEVSLLVLKELIATLKTVTWVVDDTISNVSFKCWMQALLLKLGTSCSSPSIAYSILSTIVEINPLIVIPVVKTILQNVMLQPKETQEEKQQYKIFFQAIFNMFVKLIQVQDLIRHYILPSLKELTEERRHNSIVLEDIDVCDIIPDETCLAFQSIVGMFPGQECLNVLRALNAFLTKEVVEPMEKGHTDGGHRLFLAVLDKLLTAMLGGIRMADQSILEPTCRRFMDTLVALRTCLGRFGVALIQRDPCSKSLASFLHICLATGEVQLLLLLYSPWSDQNFCLQVAQSVNPNSAVDLQCLLSFLSPQQWNDIAQKVTEANDEACQDALNTLLLQQLRTLILFENSIEHSKELQLTVSEYLVQSLGGIQLLQRKNDASVLVPLLSIEKLLSTAENIVEHLIVGQSNNEAINLLKDPILQENKSLILSIAWISVQKIGNLLVNRKRMHSAEVSIPNYRCLVKNMYSSIDYSDVLHVEKKIKFLKVAKKINEACKDLLQTDEPEADGMPLDFVRLTKYLELLQCLPLPFLPPRMQTFLVLSVLGIIIIMNELSKKSRTADLKKSKIGGDFMKNEILVNKISQQILLGLLDGPNHISLFDLLDVGLVVQLLLRGGQCPKPLLQHLFEDCVVKPDHIRNMAEAVCAADKYIEDNINSECAPNATLLLQLLQKKYLAHDISSYRAVYKETICYLLDMISQLVNRRMDSESVSEATPLVLMEACWNLLSSKPKQRKTVIPRIAPHMKRFLSCAFSVIQNPDVHREAVPMAEHLLEAIASVNDITESTFIWDAYKSINNPQFVAKLLKIAEQSEFIRIMTDLCDTLKPDHLKEFPDLRLPRNLVEIITTKHKEPYVEQLIVLVSSAAFERIMQGDSDYRLPDFMSFLLAVVRRTRVALPEKLADIILATAVRALQEQPESVGLVVTIVSTVIQLLSMLMCHYFPLVAERIPAFLQAYHLVIHVVVINSSVTLKLEEKEAEELATCALQIERFSVELKKHVKDFNAISQYLVADVLQEFEQITIHHKVKIHIMNVLYALIDICDKHAIAHLSYALPPAPLEIFKTVLTEYGKFYKYTGKV